MENANTEENENTTAKEDEQESFFEKCFVAIICCPLACWYICMNGLSGGALTGGESCTKTCLRTLCPCCCKINVEP